MAGPRRTCIACRATASAAELVRVGWPPGADGPRFGRSTGGRGAWLHPSAACLEALQADRLSRALRRTVTSEGMTGLMAALEEAAEGGSTGPGPPIGHLI